MKRTRVIEVIAAAAKLPAAKGRALIAALAISAKESVEPDLSSLVQALREDLKPLGKALASAMASRDLPAMQAALRKISKGMPEIAGDATALGKELSVRYASAFLGQDETSSGI